jgi:hypothetical protein
VRYGFRNRSGSKWSIGKIHHILTDTTYIDTFRYGRKSKSGEPVAVPAPAIVPQAIFDQVQSTLRQRNPKQTPPRTVSSPILLSGPRDLRLLWRRNDPANREERSVSLL